MAGAQSGTVLQIPTTEAVRQPTVGRTVLYRVGHLREDYLIRQGYVAEGDFLPAIIVRVWKNDLVNLKVLCDGPHDVWVPAVSNGDKPGDWSWPVLM